MSAFINWIDTHPKISKFFPVILTLVVLTILINLLYSSLMILNLLPVREQAVIILRPLDVLIGMTIYLKTSIDFAIFIGRLMAKNPGWRNRIAIEVGTAMGNAFGTISVTALWLLLKSVDLLLALMVFFASIVLLLLAHSSLVFINDWRNIRGYKKNIYSVLTVLLNPVKKYTDPLFSRIMPDLGKHFEDTKPLSFDKLLSFSIGVPFILGLDDFAGYVPLFTIVNLFSFATGVLIGHTLLNIALFLSPGRTITIVKNEFVTFIGILAFIGLSFYGFWEAVKIVFSAFH